jgi:hypothetical protein
MEVSKKAAEKGIRIVPIGCSGIDKPTEFLCRNIALATNGTYTFLTNHSGVGGTHIEPSTDGYKVESFREVLVRVARLMSITPIVRNSSHLNRSNKLTPIYRSSILTERKIRYSLIARSIQLKRSWNWKFCCIRTRRMVCFTSRVREKLPKYLLPM